MKLTDLALVDLLAAFRSPEPTPGGGSASALVGALGAALVAMVAGLPKSRAATEEDVERLAAAGSRCTDVSTRLASLVDRDAEAYDTVVSAFRKPKGTDAEKAARQQAVQDAMKMATDTPLAVMRACSDAIEQAPVVAAFGNRNAASDLQVGLELLGSGLRGARSNVDINLGSLKDAVYVKHARNEAERLSAEGATEIAAARAALERD